MVTSGIGLVAHSGGPTAVINASLVGVVQESRRHRACLGVYGARFGIEGILAGDFIDLYELTERTLLAIGNAPSSVLGNSRDALSDDDLDRVFRIFAKHNVRFLYYTGGNGSMGTAQQIHEAALERSYEMQVIGVPKTIDNDICETDHTPGFGSAARFFASAVRDIGADNRALPNQVEVIEILGRNVGWLAASTALARHEDGDAPHLIYFPETRLSLETYLSDISRVYAERKRCVVAICEGQLDDRGEPFGADVRQGSRGSLAQNLAHRLALLTTQHLGLRARSEKPGLLGRSCGVLAFQKDRTEAMACGRAAVIAAIDGRGGSMVSIKCQRKPYEFSTGLAPLSQVAFRERMLPAEYRNDKGNDVMPAFLDYAAPLAGEIEVYPSLLEQRQI